MKNQGELGLNLSTRRTRKAVFLDEMELVVPWRELVALIAVASPVAATGRPPFAHETMLRIHFLHVWTRRHLQAPFGDVQRSAHMYTAC
jgi:IS5 family transposase